MMAATEPGAGAMRLLAWLRARADRHASATMREIREGLALPKTTALIYVMQLEATRQVVRFGARRQFVGLAGDPRLAGEAEKRAAAAQAALAHHRAVRRQTGKKVRPVPVARVAGNAPAVRTCLGCRRPFKSEGWHNRLCTPCRGESAALI